MQPCKTLGSPFEINFSVFPLPSPSCLMLNIMETAAASPLLRPLLTPKSFTFKEQLSAFRDLPGQHLEAEEEQPQVPPDPSRCTYPAESRTQQNCIPTGYPDLQGELQCSRGDAEQPYKEQFFVFLITQLCLIGKSNNLRNAPLACAISMNFHQFPCIAVANLVLVPEVHTVQAAVKTRMNKGNSTNINLVGKCCSALHKFSIRVLIRDITTPKSSTPCR